MFIILSLILQHIDDMLNPKLKFCQGYKRSASNSVKYKVCFTLEEGKSIQFGLDSCKSKAEIAVEISSGFCIHVRTCKDKRKGDAYAMRSSVNVCNPKVSAMVVINALFADRLNTITKPILHMIRIDSNYQTRGRG
jgi:hypothetical protein